MSDTDSAASSDDPTAPAEEAAAERWVVQSLGQERRLALILDSTPGAVRVRFRDGQTFDWGQLPSSARPIVPGTVEWRTVVEPEQVGEQLAADAPGLIAQILREASVPLATDEIRLRLEGWGLTAKKGKPSPGLPNWEDVWKPARAALLIDEHVVFDSDRKTYTWSEAPVPRTERARPKKSKPAEGDSVGAAVRRLGGRLTDSRRDDDKRLLREAHSHGELDPSQSAVCMAAGVLAEADISWDQVTLDDSLPERLVNALFDLAARQGAISWIFEQRLTSRAQLVADAVERVANALPAGQLSRAVEETLEAVRRSLDADDNPESRAARSIEAIRSLVAIPSSDVVTSALRLLADIARRTDSARWDHVVAQVGRLLANADPAVLATAVGSGSDASAVAVGVRMADLPMDEQSGRLGILRALAVGRRSVFNAPGAVGLFAGVDIATIVAVVEADDALSSVLLSADRGVADRVTVPAIHRRLASSDVAGFVGVAGWPRRLQRLVPVDAWVEAVQRSEAGGDALIGRALAHVEATTLDLAAESADADRTDLRTGLEAELERLRAELDAAVDRSARLQAQVARLEAAAREATDAQIDAFESQLLQAKMATLRSIAEIGEDLHRSMATDSSEILKDAYERLRREAGSHGLAPLEEVGEIVPFDRGRHRPADGTNGPDVRVIEPAWGVEQNGSVAIVRSGLVAAV